MVECKTNLGPGVVKDLESFTCEIDGEVVEVSSWELVGSSVDAKQEIFIPLIKYT